MEIRGVGQHHADLFKETAHLFIVTVDPHSWEIGVKNFGK